MQKTGLSYKYIFSKKMSFLHIFQIQRFRSPGFGVRVSAFSSPWIRGPLFAVGFDPQTDLHPEPGVSGAGESSGGKREPVQQEKHRFQHQ